MWVYSSLSLFAHLITGNLPARSLTAQMKPKVLKIHSPRATRSNGGSPSQDPSPPNRAHGETRKR